MSTYKDFVKDYPKRCIDVLDKFYEKAKTADREVTLLLMAAAGGLVMPYERLSLGKSIKQPNLDRGARKKQMDELKNELTNPIKNSVVFGNIIRTWRYGNPGIKHDDEDIKRACAKAKTISTEEQVSFAINIIRHSIAHGNVMALESPYFGQIQELVFVSRDRRKDAISVEFVVLTPGELEVFLRQWCKFLSSLSLIRQQEALGILESVAI